MPMKYVTTQYISPLGEIGLACSETALTALWLPGQKTFDREAQRLPSPDNHPILSLCAGWLDRYFAGECPASNELPLAPEGSPFRKRIWELLLQIPCGETTTYGTLANQAALLLGKERMSAQAVGGAVGANPISIIIPCHRCLGSGGRLTGYAGGLHLKKYLLDLEGIPYSE